MEVEVEFQSEGNNAMVADKLKGVGGA